MLNREMIILHWQSKFYEKKLIRNRDKEVKPAPLIRQGRCKHMNIGEKAPAKFSWTQIRDTDSIEHDFAFSNQTLIDD